MTTLRFTPPTDVGRLLVCFGVAKDHGETWWSCPLEQATAIRICSQWDCFDVPLPLPPTQFRGTNAAILRAILRVLPRDKLGPHTPADLEGWATAIQEWAQPFQLNPKHEAP